MVIINIDWYQKPTLSAHMLNFNSNHPMTHKVEMVKILVNRLIEISDKEVFHIKNSA